MVTCKRKGSWDKHDMRSTLGFLVVQAQPRISFLLMLDVLRLVVVVVVVVVVVEEVVVVTEVIVDLVVVVVVVVVEIVVLGFHDILMRVENMETPDECSLC